MYKHKRHYALPGLHINVSHEPILEWIFSRYKTAETRPNARLDDYMGETIGLIQTGRGCAKLVGFARVANYSMSTCSYEEFHSRWYQPAHRIERGSFYDMKPGKRKFVYWLEDVRRIEPIDLPASTFTGDRTFRELYDFVSANSNAIKYIDEEAA